MLENFFSTITYEIPIFNENDILFHCVRRTDTKNTHWFSCPWLMLYDNDAREKLERAHFALRT